MYVSIKDTNSRLNETSGGLFAIRAVTREISPFEGKDDLDRDSSFHLSHLLLDSLVRDLKVGFFDLGLKGRTLSIG